MGSISVMLDEKIKDFYDFCHPTADIQEDMQELIKKTRQKEYRQIARRKELIATLNELRKDTLYESVVPFWDVFKKIYNNTTMNTEIPEITKIEYRVRPFNYDRVCSTDSEGGHSLCWRRDALDAQQELKELAQYRKMQAGLMRVHNDFLSKDLIPTIKTLSLLLQKWTEGLNALIERKGTDFKAYSEEEKQFVRSGGVLANTVSQFITETYLTENGNLKTRYKKIFEEAPTLKKGIFDSEKKYIDYFDGKIRG